MNDKELGRLRMERIVQFLYQFRVATNEQLSKVCSQGDKPSQSSRTRILSRLKAHGIIADYAPFGSVRKIWYVTNNGCIFTPVSWIGATNGQNISHTQLLHTLSVSSIGSQILNETEINPLGIPDNEWAAVRNGVTNGTTRLISENEINTSWAQKQNEIGADTMRDIFANTIENGGSIRDNMVKAVREYDPDHLFTWRLATSAYAYDPNTKTYLDADNVLDASQLPKRVTLPGDERVLLTDHPIDLGVCVDNGGRPYTVAVEIELNPKNLQSYISTLASFQSEIGLNMFDRVVWLCTENTTINLLNKALKIVGNTNGQIIIKKIVPGQNTGLWVGCEVFLEDNISYINDRIATNKAQAKEKKTTRKQREQTAAARTATNETKTEPTRPTTKPAAKQVRQSKPVATPQPQPTKPTTAPQTPTKPEPKRDAMPTFNYDFLDKDEDSGDKDTNTGALKFNLNIVSNEKKNPFSGGNR